MIELLCYANKIEDWAKRFISMPPKNEIELALQKGKTIVLKTFIDKEIYSSGKALKLWV